MLDGQAWVRDDDTGRINCPVDVCQYARVFKDHCVLLHLAPNSKCIYVAMFRVYHIGVRMGKVIMNERKQTLVLGTVVSTYDEWYK